MTLNCLFQNKPPVLTTESPCGCPPDSPSLCSLPFLSFFFSDMQGWKSHINEADSVHCIIRGCKCPTGCWLIHGGACNITTCLFNFQFFDCQAKLGSQPKVAEVSSHLTMVLPLARIIQHCPIPH